MNLTKQQKQTIFNVLSIVGILLCIAFVWWSHSNGLLTDQAKMKQWIESFGLFGPIIFILIQILQTVIPIIPGALTVVGGVVIFGYFWGSILNFTGIIIGSVILFLITRRYGEPFVRTIVGDKTYDKYYAWVEKHSNRFELFFALAMASPISPADVIVAISALTPIKFKRFFWIIVFCKPISIFCYSLVTTEFISWLFSFFR